MQHPTNKQYRCRFFKIHELVPPDVYNERSDKAWQLLDSRLLITLDRMRMRYGPITVNNYFWGHDRKYSGLRTPDSEHYSPTSQHTFGRAADCIFREIGVDVVRTDILEHPYDTEFQHINAIELDTSWLHFDVRNCDRVMTFKP